MENERSEPGHLKCGGVDNVKFKIENAGSPKSRKTFWGARDGVPEKS